MHRFSIALLFLVACSGEVAPIPPTPYHDLPKADPDAGAPADGQPVAFRMTKLYYGDADWSGNASYQAWKGFGHDIDGVNTSDKDAPASCRAPAGASPMAKLDGNDGIDNSFGANVVPVIITVKGADAATKINDRVRAGDLTNFVTIASLGPASSYDPLRVSFAAGAPLGHPPAADDTERWPLRAPAVDLGRGYMTNRTLVAGPSDVPVLLALDVLGVTLELPVHRMVVTMDVAPDARSAAHGIVSGIIPNADFLRIFDAAAPLVSADLFCKDMKDENYATAANTINRASDILVDGTNDPSRPCDGISIGLGFDAVRVTPGDVVPVPPAVGTCP